MARARKLWDSEFKKAEIDPVHLDDPEFRLNYELERTLGLTPHPGDPLPSVIAIVGDLEEAEAFALLERSFGSLKAGKPRTKQRLAIGERQRSVRLAGKAQSQFGYAVPAPPPSDPKSYAYRLLLYIMTHDYEGRLGMELINRRGLISHIDSSYNSDGHGSWISMTMGVNPDKLQAVRSAFEQILEDLSEDPPAEQELAEAKQHLIGRRMSAYESNEELSAFYAREWIEQGRLADQREFEKRVRGVTGEEVRKIIPQFLHGVTVTIDTTTHPEERSFPSQRTPPLVVQPLPL